MYLILIWIVGHPHIDNLKRFVIEINLDVGFTYDGDADRCIAVDDKRNEINYIMTTFGDKYINDEMVKNGYIFGGRKVWAYNF